MFTNREIPSDFPSPREPSCQCDRAGECGTPGSNASPTFQYSQSCPSLPTSPKLPPTTAWSSSLEPVFPPATRLTASSLSSLDAGRHHSCMSRCRWKDSSSSSPGLRRQRTGRTFPRHIVALTRYRTGRIVCVRRNPGRLLDQHGIAERRRAVRDCRATTAFGIFCTGRYLLQKSQSCRCGDAWFHKYLGYVFKMPYTSQRDVDLRLAALSITAVCS